jgi:hypothetical protein
MLGWIVAGLLALALLAAVAWYFYVLWTATFRG